MNFLQKKQNLTNTVNPTLTSFLVSEIIDILNFSIQFLKYCFVGCKTLCKCYSTVRILLTLHILKKLSMLIQVALVSYCNC